ncbi:single-stranded DNA-binding protein [bacterium]|nr:single-stranded DNA-binding protein [bacterium]
MSLARATISGTVYRAPEKRFTSNNVPITGFTININPDDETLIRVIAKGNLADTMVNSINKGDTIVVEGRLQNNTVKAEDGSEKRIVEIDASSFEKIGGSSSSTTKSVSSSMNESEQIVKFGADEFSESLIGEDEIPF